MDEVKCVRCGTPIPWGITVCPKCEEMEPSFDTTKISVNLNRITDISKFVAVVSKCRDDVVVRSGRFAVNAKSIMGLFSLDLTNPLTVEFYGNVPYEVQEEMKNFMIE